MTTREGQRQGWVSGAGVPHAGTAGAPSQGRNMPALPRKGTVLSSSGQSEGRDSVAVGGQMRQAGGHVSREDVESGTVTGMQKADPAGDSEPRGDATQMRLEPLSASSQDSRRAGVEASQEGDALVHVSKGESGRVGDAQS